MAKLKLVPKIMIAAVIAGGVYYGADHFISSGKLQKQVAANAAEQAATQPEVEAPAAEPVQQAPQQVAVQPQQVQQPAVQMPEPEQSDAGMANLLKNSRK